MGITSADMLASQTREQSLSGYLRLSRDAIEAAVWLKRYVEAAAPEEPQGDVRCATLSLSWRGFATEASTLG